MKAIITKFHGQTEHKPAFILAKDMDGNRFKQSTNAAHDTDYDLHQMAANGLINKMGWGGAVIGGGIKGGYAWVFNV